MLEKSQCAEHKNEQALSVPKKVEPTPEKTIQEHRQALLAEERRPARLVRHPKKAHQSAIYCGHRSKSRSNDSGRGELSHRAPPSARDTVRYPLPILAGIDSAHAHGIIHRDLKPDHISLASDDSGAMQPKIVDFGIAKMVHTAAGQSPPRTSTISCAFRPRSR